MIRWTGISKGLVLTIAAILFAAGTLAAAEGGHGGGGKGACCKKASGAAESGGGCKGCGHGEGKGGHGKGMADHENIHFLLDRHAEIVRHVEEIDNGVETVTTSENPEVTKVIRQHVREMQQRVESGQGMRWWDPVYAELFRHYDKIAMEVDEIPGGMLVRETSEDDDVVLLIRQHAIRGVSEFVKDGRARAPHPTPLPEGYSSEKSSDSQPTEAP